jgi:hypothetical protein
MSDIPAHIRRQAALTILQGLVVRGDLANEAPIALVCRAVNLADMLETALTMSAEERFDTIYPQTTVTKTRGGSPRTRAARRAKAEQENGATSTRTTQGPPGSPTREVYGVEVAGA